MYFVRFYKCTSDNSSYQELAPSHSVKLETCEPSFIAMHRDARHICSQKRHIAYAICSGSCFSSGELISGIVDISLPE